MASGDVETWFVDTNVLVYANMAQAPLHAVALMRLQEVARVRYFQRRFQVADETAVVTARLLTLLRTIPAGGAQIHDANIVATLLCPWLCTTAVLLPPRHNRGTSAFKLCFARKVGRFASKIGRLASKRHKWHLERVTGSTLQAWTKGPYETIAALPSGLSSPKNPALSQRLGYCWPTYLRRDNSQHTPGNPDRIRRTSYRSAASPDAERLGDNSMAEKREAERRC